MMNPERKSWLRRFRIVALCALVALLTFAMGVVSQKFGYPHQVKEALLQIFHPAQSGTETTPESELVVPTVILTTDVDILRQSLVVDPVRVSLNNRQFAGNASGQYRFLTAGHVYGAPHDEAPHPAASWIDFIPQINQMDPDMLFFVGDMVPTSTALRFEDFEDQVLQHLQMPAFNVVGNHDVEYRSLYEQRYGSTFYTFRHGPGQFIVLDTELDACKIEGTQKAFLEAAVVQALNDPQVSSLFILMHKALFLDREALKLLFESGNVKVAPNAQECYLEHNFEDILLATLLSAAEQKPVYIVAGDVGAWGGNLSPFYYEVPNSNLTLLAAGIGDSKEDVSLVIDYSKQGVLVNFLRLDGQLVVDFRQYDLNYYTTLAENAQ